MSAVSPTVCLRAWHQAGVQTESADGQWEITVAGLGDVTEGANLTSGGPAGRLLPFLQVKGEGDLGYLLAAEVKTGQQGPDT